MASGKTHDRSAIVSLPFVIWALYSYLSINQIELTLFIGSYLISALLLSPDLDGARSNSKRRLGIFGIVWLPLQWASKHRGWNHRFLIGLLIRLLYLISALIVAIAVVRTLPSFFENGTINTLDKVVFIFFGNLKAILKEGINMNFHALTLKEYSMIFLGLLIPESLHLFLDHIPFIKKI